LDEIIVFNPLTEKVLADILELHMRDLRERLAKQGLSLVLAESARDLILGQGYDPANGARPLRRAIERLLTRPLSQYILDGDYAPGSTSQGNAAEGKLAFTVQVNVAAAAQESAPAGEAAACGDS